MLSRWLPFEKPLVEIEEQIDEIKRLSTSDGIDTASRQKLMDNIERLESHKREVMRRIYADLSPWDKVQMARHPKRPYSLDIIGALCTDWIELHGDRAFGDDGAIVAGFARFRGRPIAIVGNQKGRDTKERQARNFGQPSPEGLRKAGRVMEMAARFGRPILSLVDTPGAACSPAAEERGISEAIAHSQMMMSALKVPILVAIIGEGCSGGAIATALGDRVLMLEHSYYSVISPEACASILFRDPAKAPVTSQQLKITAQDALRLKVIEEIVEEPLGGAHRDLPAMGKNLGDALERHLGELDKLNGDDLIEARYQRFRKLGDFDEPQTEPEFHPELNGHA
ncbi:acetyl-CoA carboxylase carboxyltransferase subunit alpha [bacterium]|nr:MAG: acetyl-CoA carboxylase carboxyltransferase subunit alpha [bacterium]